MGHSPQALLLCAAPGKSDCGCLQGIKIQSGSALGKNWASLGLRIKLESQEGPRRSLKEMLPNKGAREIPTENGREAPASPQQRKRGALSTALRGGLELQDGRRGRPGRRTRTAGLELRGHQRTCPGGRVNPFKVKSPKSRGAVGHADQRHDGVASDETKTMAARILVDSHPRNSLTFYCPLPSENRSVTFSDTRTLKGFITSRRALKKCHSRKETFCNNQNTKER